MLASNIISLPFQVTHYFKIYKKITKINLEEALLNFTFVVNGPLQLPKLQLLGFLTK